MGSSGAGANVSVISLIINDGFSNDRLEEMGLNAATIWISGGRELEL